MKLFMYTRVKLTSWDGFLATEMRSGRNSCNFEDRGLNLIDSKRK